MRFDTLVVGALIFFAANQSAHAYIDPGTGSVVTTAILGFFAAIAYTFRKYMYRIKDAITGRKAVSPKAGDQRDAK